MAGETTAITHSAKCEMHNDIDNLQGQCNATTKSTRPCLLKPVVSIAGYLPVCHLHRAQAEKHILARCLAIEPTCGARCNAVCRWDAAADLNHTCTRHKHTALPCFFNRLPLELRIMVFELLIPDGPVPTEMPERRNPYANMAAIARVNKELSSQVYTVMYQTASRRCEVYVEHGYAMHMAGREFKLSLCPAPLPALNWQPMYEMHRIGKFSHYHVRFDISVFNWNRSNIFHLMSAISEVNTAAAVTPFHCPEVHIEFEAYAYDFSNAGKSQWNDECLTSIISGIRSVLAVAVAYRIKLEWSVLMTTRSWPSNDMVQLILTASRMEVTSGIITPDLLPAIRRVLLGFDTLRMYAWAQPTATCVASLMTTWRRFTESYSTLRDLVEVGYIVVDVPEDELEDFLCEFSGAAKEGLEEGRASCSMALLRHVNAAKDLYVAHHQHNIDALQRRHAALANGAQPLESPRKILRPHLLPQPVSDFMADYKSKEIMEFSRPWLEVVERSRAEVGLCIDHHTCRSHTIYARVRIRQMRSS